MKNITINLPEMYLQIIEGFVSQGTYPSRSEAIRDAIRDFLRKEMNVMNLYNSEITEISKRKEKNENSYRQYNTP